MDCIRDTLECGGRDRAVLDARQVARCLCQSLLDLGIEARLFLVAALPEHVRLLISRPLNAASSCLFWISSWNFANLSSILSCVAVMADISSLNWAEEIATGLNADRSASSAGVDLDPEGPGIALLSLDIIAHNKGNRPLCTLRTLPLLVHQA